MSNDSYSAVWVSHTSIYDFITCPRAYYLKNVYRDPSTKHKIKLITPPLALGQVIHEVLEAVSKIPSDSRFEVPLTARFHEQWKQVTEKKGGFINVETESLYRKRGEDMLIQIQNNPGVLKKRAVKIKLDLPHYWLSEKDNIILCGKIDWLEYLEDTDSVHIIDFKTSKYEEDASSLQLPIYYLLAKHCQSRRVSKASYWYLDREIEPKEIELPDEIVTERKLLELAKQIKLAKQLNRFKCPHGNSGCYACIPYEKIVKGEAEYIYTNRRNERVFINTRFENEKESEIL